MTWRSSPVSEPLLLVHQSLMVAPLQPWEWPVSPWDRLHIDFAEWNKQHYFVVVDSHSKWLEVFPMYSTTATETIDILCTLFASYGLPREIVSDNGPPFSSKEFEAFMMRNGIKHTRVAPYHPSTNGAAERSVQIVKRALTKQMLDDNPTSRELTLQVRLSNFLFNYRNSPHIPRVKPLLTSS